VILFHYFNEQHGLEALQKHRIKVGRLFDLNDPADCRPRLMNVPTETKVKQADYFSFFYQNIGVLCFCEQVDDPVIWTHYADGHRGIAIGYEVLGVLHPVQYGDTPPRIDYLEAEALRTDGKITQAFADKVIPEGFRQKAKSWKYESEQRMFLNLGRLEMEGPHYFLQLPQPYIKVAYVILGCRSKLTRFDVERAGKRIPLLRRDAPRIFKARMRANSFLLEISDPVTRVPLELPEAAVKVRSLKEK